jgi:hypothetical protein
MGLLNCKPAWGYAISMPVFEVGSQRETSEKMYFVFHFWNIVTDSEQEKG